MKADLDNIATFCARGNRPGTPAREGQFSVDELGNWPGYLTKTSGTTDLSQTRTHSNVTETTGITGGSWVTPQYDNGSLTGGDGNMTLGPKPGSETTMIPARRGGGCSMPDRRRGLRPMDAEGRSNESHRA